jgi:hypothetical protein
MPVQLNYKNVRDLAKKFREITGREVKHTEIIGIVAEVLGRRPDAMMHELKSEVSDALLVAPVSRKKEIPQWSARPDEPAGISNQAVLLAKESGFRIWDIGEGRTAFAMMLRQDFLPDGSTADMALLLTDQNGQGVLGDPESACWMGALVYKASSGLRVAYSTGVDGFTLDETISLALSFKADVNLHWNDFFNEDVSRLDEKVM